MFAFAGSIAPSFASQPAISYDDLQSQRVMQLLDGQSCAARFDGKPAQVAQVQFTPTPSPSPTPSFPPFGQPNGGLYATPFPRGSAVTPLPVPTLTPTAAGTPGPVYLTRSSAPPSIAPARPFGSASPEASPTGVPTLPPGHLAVLADKVTGSTKAGIPGDATGNVHIFYADEVIVGDRAHYDGIKTITISGHTYIENQTKDSVLYADQIVFDTVAEKAVLYKGRGESTQGVETGLVYYSAVDMKSDQHGVSHGDYTSLTTCENPRGGYHVTGRTIDVYPGDKIVITKAVMWLGAAAVFFLPRVVIPLRTVSDERQKPQLFPDIGYNELQGFYVRAKIGFGKDQYYYGTYDIEFYTKQGITLGYNGQIAKKNGKRVTQISLQRVQNHLPGGSNTTNAQIQDTENFGQNLRGQFGFNYQGSYGPYTNFPPQEQYSAQVAHTQARESQTYTFNRSETTGQSTSDNYGFTDTRTFQPELQNDFSLALSHSSTYGTFTSSNATATISDLLHWASRGADYELNYDKTLAATPFGLNKEPELTIRPIEFMPHFIFPVAPTFTVGEYNEPATPETTQRADLAFDIGPALYHIYGSDFSATVNVSQFLYGTGDEKASIQQTMSLTTPIGRHIVNNISYNEQNFNGPGTVPFSTIDLQNTPNTKTANDIVRIFNNEVYDLSLSFSTLFMAQAQPVSYVLTTRPSRRSYASISGTFNPGPGNGFFTTNFQTTTPFGRDSWLQFVGDFNWKEKGRIENKSIFYSHIIGNCYEFQVQYNQSASTVNVVLFILAFPSHAANFGLNYSGNVLPSSFNGTGF